MGWRVTDFSLEACGGLARTFQFEVAIPVDAEQAERVLRGDGLLLHGERVRFNREAEMRRCVSQAGIDSDTFISGLQTYVLDAASQPHMMAV